MSDNIQIHTGSHSAAGQQIGNEWIIERVSVDIIWSRSSWCDAV